MYDKQSLIKWTTLKPKLAHSSQTSTQTHHSWLGQCCLKVLQLQLILLNKRQKQCPDWCSEQHLLLWGTLLRLSTIASDEYSPSSVISASPVLVTWDRNPVIEKKSVSIHSTRAIGQTPHTIHCTLYTYLLLFPECTQLSLILLHNEEHWMIKLQRDSEQ